MKKSKNEKSKPLWVVAAPALELSALPRPKDDPKEGERDEARRVTIARHCLSWARQPEMREKLFGRGESWLEIHNKVRKVFGREPLRLEDLPPEDHWEAVPTPKERKIATYRSFGLTPDGKELPEAEDIGYFGPLPARVRRLQRLKKAKLTTDASDNTDKGKAIK